MAVDFKNVNEAELQTFIAAYPRKLERDVFGACEPPLVTWNDFERAPKWPDSVVASKRAGQQGGRIIADINSPVPDNGKRDTDSALTDRDGQVLLEGDRVSAVWGFGPPSTESYGRTYGDDGSCRVIETIKIRDKGTKYEAWSFESCHNNARGFDMKKVPQ